MTLICALFLSACGGGSDAPTATSASGPAPAPSAQAPAPTSPAPGAAPSGPAPVAAERPSRASTVPVQLLQATPVARLGRAQLDAAIAQTKVAALAGPSVCDVDLVDITYTTAAPDGSPTVASGAVMLPSGATCPGPFRLLGYTRGTDLTKTRSMSDASKSEVAWTASFLAGQGYVVASTDYLGYNRSQFPRHPYLHADSEAQAEIDAMRAARLLTAQQKIALAPTVYLAGYSQGGHASLATQRLIARHYAAEFPVAAAAHMSGPYDLVLTLRSAVDALPIGDIGSTYYLPFTITSLQSVHGDLYQQTGDYFKAPYDTTVDNLFPGSLSVQQAITERKLPILLRDLVTDRFREDARNDATPLVRSLRANSPYDFRATAPTLFCAGGRDGVVPVGNMERASAALAGSSAGVPVTAVDVETVDRFRGALPAPLSPAEVLTSYHAVDVPPLCLMLAREHFAAHR